MKTVKNIFITLVLLAVAFGAGYYTAKHYPPVEPEIVEQTEEEEFDLELPGEVEKTIVTVDEVEAKILEIGELASAEGDYTVTKGRDYTRYVLDDYAVPGTTSHIELTCTGIVKAGYEMKDVTVKVDNDSQKIYVSLPEARILSNEILWGDDMISEEKNNILNPLEFEQYKGLIAEIKDEGLQKAEGEGLYDTVEDNAKNLITNFLGCFADYEVVFM